MRKNHLKLILILITVVGILIRIVFLNSRPITFDEGSSLMNARASVTEMVQGTMADVHPPLYFFLLHFWLKINSSLVFLRAFSIIFGAATIYLMGIIANKLFDKRAGILCAILVAFSPVFIFDSTNLRMYSLAVFESVLVIYYFLQFLKRHNLVNSLGLVGSIIAGFYTQYFFIFVPISLNLYLLLKRHYYQRILKSWFLAQIAIGLFFLPLAYLYLTSPHPLLFPAPNSILKLPAILPTTIVSWDAIQILKLYPLTEINLLFIVMLVLCSIFLLTFLFSLQNIRFNRLLFLFLLSYFFIPLSLVLLISYLVKPIFALRSLIIFAPALYLITALGLSRLKNNFNIVLFFCFFIFFLILQYQGFNQSWESAAPYSFVEKNLQKDDLITYSDVSISTTGHYYFTNNDNFALVPTWLSVKTAESIDYKQLKLPLTDLKYKRLWYFLLDPQYFNGQLAQSKQKELETLFPVVFTKKFEDQSLQITLFDLSAIK